MSHFDFSVLLTLAQPYPGKSTMFHSSFIAKKLIVCVFPGVEDVFANLLLFVRRFINDDFPTLDLPINANSGVSFVGHFF